MSFDLLAPHYRWMECILAGKKLQRCRIAFLAQIAVPKNILLMGEGHGRFLCECCERFPEARITCADASAAMLKQSRAAILRHGAGSDRVRFTHVDALTWQPAESYDLIVTNFFLDCFQPDQLALVISTLAASAAPSANWLIADFQMPQAGWRRTRARLILRIMYAFFRVVTRLPARELTAPDGCLKQNGFTLRRRTDSEWGLLRSDWWTR